MELQYAHSPDGARLAFEVAGEGPPLVLLHGALTQDRNSWKELGYVDRLRPFFSVITPDLRGHGDSDRPLDPAAYRHDAVLADVLAVADAAGAHRFRLWGFSFGGAIGLRLAAASDRVERAVIGGAYLGPLFTPEYVARTASLFDAVEAARRENTLDALDLTPAERLLAGSDRYPLARSLFEAMTAWPSLAPENLKCPVFLYAGANDKPAVAAFARDGEAMARAGVRFRVYPGLDHLAGFSRVDLAYPEAEAFLRTPQAG